MREISVLVVDDEPHAREGLAGLIASQDGYRLIGMAGDGPTAVRSILELRPDVVLLDVQMPGMTGLDVIATVGTGEMPYVIFVTAHDDFALAAFEHAALDYVLKPFKDARLLAALTRARAALSERDFGVIGRRLLETLGELGIPQLNTPPPGTGLERREPITRFAVRTGNRITMVPVEDVERIEAANYCAKLYVGNQVYVVRHAMLELEQRLDRDTFVRVHRSHIVRRARIREFRRSAAGEHSAILADGSRVPVGRNRWTTVVAACAAAKES